MQTINGETFPTTYNFVLKKGDYILIIDNFIAYFILLKMPGFGLTIHVVSSLAVKEVSGLSLDHIMSC